MPAAVSNADHDTHDVHEVKAMLRGEDECRCRVCRRVAAGLSARASAHRETTMHFKTTDIECVTAFGRYSLSCYAADKWSVRYIANGGGRSVPVEPPVTSEDDEPESWQSLEAAKDACRKHYAHLGDLGTALVAG